jgi:hypothetical protein
MTWLADLSRTTSADVAEIKRRIDALRIADKRFTMLLVTGK